VCIKPSYIKASGEQGVNGLVFSNASTVAGRWRIRANQFELWEKLARSMLAVRAFWVIFRRSRHR
jgi:hypothetical protein